MSTSKRKQKEPKDNRPPKVHKQHKSSDSRVQFLTRVYIGLGVTAKQEIFTKFLGTSDIVRDLAPRVPGEIQKLEITKEGFPPLYTMDYYFTNKEPKQTLAVITQTEDPQASAAAQAGQISFENDPLQPGEIRIPADKVPHTIVPFLDL